jgi:hypothetical protein
MNQVGLLRVTKQSASYLYPVSHVRKQAVSHYKLNSQRREFWGRPALPLHNQRQLVNLSSSIPATISSPVGKDDYPARRKPQNLASLIIFIPGAVLLPQVPQRRFDFASIQNGAKIGTRIWHLLFPSRARDLSPWFLLALDRAWDIRNGMFGDSRYG